uniref:Uncharacterized protein n=1 Tax=Dulem virus 79 TaxID=3145790 RepID=A0AAU8B503_9VIRU
MEKPLWKHLFWFMIFGPFYVLYLYLNDKKDEKKVEKS